MSNKRSSAFFLAASLWALAVPAGAQEPRQEFHLPAQGLGDALRALGSAARREIIFTPEAVAGKSVGALEGAYTFKEALDAMLAGSGLATVEREGTVLIVGRSQAPLAPAATHSEDAAILVTGSRIRGAPPASPVTVLSSREIAQAGQTDLGEAVRTLPQSFGGGQNPGVAPGAPGSNNNQNSGSSINLRGLGPDATLTLLMKRADTTEIAMRIIIDRPVPGLLHSLQSREGDPIDPLRSSDGEPLAFDFVVRVGPGPKFFGDQVRPEGPSRRFVYVRVGQAAGDHASPWSRRMKIDIHDIDPALLARAAQGGIIVTTICGTANDGSPACATVPALRRELVER